MEKVEPEARRLLLEMRKWLRLARAAVPCSEDIRGGLDFIDESWQRVLEAEDLQIGMRAEMERHVETMDANADYARANDEWR